ncbi:MAG: cytochrome c oxidase subunit CcoM [Oleiphilaceae bacterium]|nr:cytochrome c oxidase subunit CcoM [Oleiphilaceae bacterium]
MFIDETIVSELLVVTRTIVFLAGFGWIVYKDLNKSGK